MSSRNVVSTIEQLQKDTKNTGGFHLFIYGKAAKLAR